MALGVFFHHAVIAYYEQKTGIWGATPIRFYNMIGHIGVEAFFMITAFLFWEKAMDKRVRLNGITLYISRFKRLAPAYYFSVMLVLLAMAAPIGEHSLSELHRHDLKTILLFAGVNAASSINYSYWTLPWEWLFYLMLFLTALFAQGFRGLIPATAIVLYTYHYPKDMVIFNFVCGALVAVLVKKYDMRAYLRHPAVSILCFAPLIALYSCFDSDFGYMQSLLIAAFFLCIAYGNSLFGLLHCKPALMLGTISYSVYLLHCIVVYAVIRILNMYAPLASMDALNYWLWMGVTGTLTLVLSAFSYRYFEHPFMKQRPVKKPLKDNVFHYKIRASLSHGG